MSYDNNYYAKSYRFAKKTVDARYVEFVNKTTFESTRVNVDGWRGQWLLSAIDQFFNLETVKVEKRLRKVQLNSLFTLQLQSKIGGVEIYQRRIAGTVYDYCVLHNDETFHGENIRVCIKGLKAKRAARIKADVEIISYETARELGYCDTGIRQFCEDNDLEIDAQLTRAELRAVVIAHRATNCNKYQGELRTLQISLNCK